MMVHRVENDLWDLRAGCIVKEGEPASPIQRRESSANGRNGKVRCGRPRLFGIEKTFGLQTCPQEIEKGGTVRRGLEYLFSPPA